jgi:hypothetical protein
MDYQKKLLQTCNLIGQHVAAAQAYYAEMRLKNDETRETRRDEYARDIGMQRENGAWREYAALRSLQRAVSEFVLELPAELPR